MFGRGRQVQLGPTRSPLGTERFERRDASGYPTKSNTIRSVIPRKEFC
jgi:hypothetical protein